MAKWFKLDNAAKIYPPVINRHWASLFRMSVDFNEDIDVNYLKQALEITLKRFPTFSCTLKSGLFWYYLDSIEGLPPIEQDIYNPLQRFSFKKNNGFLFRVLYYQNRLAIEYFHSLTDGTGGLTFILTLSSCYLNLRYGTKIEAQKYILDVKQEALKEETEDSFLIYGNSPLIPLKEPFSYMAKSHNVPYNKLLITCGIVQTDKLKEVANRYNTTVGIFTGSLLLYSYYQLYKKDTRTLAKKRMVKISIPVNLRNYFPSKTLRNFSSFINPGFYGQLGDYSFEETIQIVRNYVESYVTEKQLGAKISFNVKAEKNILVRIAPLFIKNIILQFIYYFDGDIYYGSTISNMGNVVLSEPMNDYIKRIDFMLGRAMSARSLCGCISYNNQTIFNFTRTRLESDLEREFFTALVKMGLEVYIESNGGY